MPTYEYRCKECGHEFELFQSITARPISKCPECGKNKAKRLIGRGGALIFKGSGFYQTDYRSDGYQQAAKAEKSSDSTSSSSSTTDSNAGGKSESKSGTSEGSKSSKSEVS